MKFTVCISNEYEFDNEAIKEFMKKKGRKKFTRREARNAIYNACVNELEACGKLRYSAIELE